MNKPNKSFPGIIHILDSQRDSGVDLDFNFLKYLRENQLRENTFYLDRNIL